MPPAQSDHDHHLDDRSLIMHRTLARQLRRICHIDSEEALERLLKAASELSAKAELSSDLKHFLSGLADFLARVNATYDQCDRDLNLRSRSLEVSSTELMQVNELMRADIVSRNHVLRKLCITPPPVCLK